MSAESVTLLEELRGRTSDRHLKLDASTFTRSLAKGTLALEGYAAMLRATLIIRDTLERTLEAHASPLITSVWISGLKRAPLLEKDLKYFEQTGVPDLPEAIRAAFAIAEKCRQRAERCPVSLLGWLYVVEGSMMGAPVLCRLARRAFGFHGDEGLSYLLSAEKGTSETWKNFAERMNALTLDQEERESLAEAAIELYDGLIDVFQILGPLDGETAKPLADSLNHEAGRHPIPSDPWELAAAERAGEVCWRMFPYLNIRYGERGRRFTSSDSAWLVTLAEGDQETANQQVLWLGRVLGARGLPRVILESQLRLLHEELITKISARTENYARLFVASEMLHGRRTAVLADDQFEAIAEKFETRTNPLPDSLRNVGRLIVSAVTDEKDGVPSAVESLTGWLTDPGRFPEAWIHAVEETVGETRRLMPDG